ncbi:MAG: hypothetical protein HYZ14_19060 [Bacteroidetes bacterium]|nr:hypothetical protein [Bacteroidota bacterium]
MLSVTLLTSCSGSSDKGKLLATVGDKELYQADLNFLFSHNRYSFDDSVALVNDYTTQWIEEQILVNEAEKSGQIDHEIIEVRVENFKNDLLIQELENGLIKERLDTTVSEDEIQAYYLANQKEFQLNDYLVKVLYLKIPFDAPDIEKIGQAYKLNKESDLEEIQVYAKIYATNFYYDAENWIYFDDLLKEVPLQDVNKDKFILKRSKTRFEEGGFYYFLNIIDYKLKNSISPLSFEKENIKERILNMRIRNLREEIKNEIVNKAYAEQNVKIY